MSTNEKNPQNDRNLDGLNRIDNLKGEAGKAVTSNFENQDWDKKSLEDKDRKAPKTTNPSAVEGFEANRDRHKYDDNEQNSEDKRDLGSK